MPIDQRAIALYVGQMIQMLTTTELMRQIDRFLAATGMTEEMFGQKACGNRKLIPRVRVGGDFKLTRVNQIQRFLEANKPPPRRKSSPRKKLAEAAE